MNSIDVCDFLFFMDIKKTFFSTSGAEANEGAIKIARMATGKEKIIARYRTYHGSTFGAMALSNDFRNWACEPSIPSVVHCLDPYCYRCPFGLTYPTSVAVVAAIGPAAKV